MKLIIPRSLRKKTSSIARLASRMIGKATTKKGKTLQIMRARGAFHFLPVLCSSDIVHGSWWYVWGSLVSALIPFVPLIDIYVVFFRVPPDTALHEFSQTATWVLMIISGIFYTLGSLAFVRAFETPPVHALFSWYHLGTDELLGAWLFFIAALPFVPYSFVYIRNDPTNLVYWANLGASVLFILGSAAFVYVCYPTQHAALEHVTPKLLPLVQSCFGEKFWICRHVSNDWLATCWFFFHGHLSLDSWFIVFSYLC